MKKFFILLLLLTFVIPITGCVGHFNPYGEFGQFVTLSSWPENDFTLNLPKPEINENSVIQYFDIKDEAQRDTLYYITISDLTLEQYEAYKAALSDAGFGLNQYYYIDESDTSPFFPDDAYQMVEKRGLLSYSGQSYPVTGHYSEWGKDTVSVSLEYAAPLEDENIKSSLRITIMPNTAPLVYDLEKKDAFPKIENYEFLKEPEFASECTIASGSGKFGNKEAYCIRLDGISYEQYNQYIASLEDSGFSELPSTSGIISDNYTPSAIWPTPSWKYHESPFGDVRPDNANSFGAISETIVDGYWQGKLTKDNADIYCYVICSGTGYKIISGHGDGTSMIGKFVLSESKLSYEPFMLIGIISVERAESKAGE